METTINHEVGTGPTVGSTVEPAVGPTVGSMATSTNDIIKQGGRTKRRNSNRKNTKRGKKRVTPLHN